MSKKVRLKDLTRTLKLLKEPRVIKGSLLAVVGYILSPLSWWNDAIVNIPIALALAKLTNILFHINIYALFAIYYWLTNVAGLLMMYMGGSMVVKRSKSGKKEILYSVIFSILYTIIVLLILKIINVR